MISVNIFVNDGLNEFTFAILINQINVILRNEVTKDLDKL